MDVASHITILLHKSLQMTTRITHKRMDSQQ